jgi:hypothetical protein
MKRQNFFAQKLQIMIALCLTMTISSFPLWAQETNSMEKRYCPYCGMANFKTSKFCNACGTRLPDLLPVILLEAASSDSLETKTFSHAWNKPNDRPSGSAERCVAAGLIMGTIGFLGGGLVGARIDKATSDGYEEWDGLAGFVIGAPIGESLLLPVGVHMANGRRGSLPLAMLASVGITGTGIALAASAGEGGIVVAIPIAQLIACTAIERSTSRNAE